MAVLNVTHAWLCPGAATHIGKHFCLNRPARIRLYNVPKLDWQSFGVAIRDV